jgi:hypothetical protein
MGGNRSLAARWTITRGFAKHRLNLAVRTGNDVRRYQAIADSLTGIRAGAHGGIDRTGLAANEDGNITAAHKLSPNQAYFSSLGHGVCRLYGGYQSPCLDHAQSNAVTFSGHGVYLLLSQ